MPTLVNLRYKRITTNVRCPRCGSGEEDSFHVFQQCPTSCEVWQNISMNWVTTYSNQNTRTWLTWVLAKGTKEQSLVFCCALWVIWISRNQLVHERKHLSGRDIAQKIERYIAELEGVGKERRTLRIDRIQKHSEEELEDTILFDAAFEANRSRSASGVIVLNRRGEMRVLKTTLHSNVSSPFLAEAFACLQAIKLGAIINDIKSHSSLFHEIKFQFIQKSKNFQAHKIAKETLANEDERYLVRDESIYSEGVTEEEWSRNPD
ncbi:hypothetical protein Golax_016402 [Gossypium laxum]|uniref:RNase H type-1 domain-containing protein n=1 Tax=Gossypium laxum TaxID=34288 RepID=A0A7J8YX19_9ROSI|nr:hypothetical protein [Gossypium laxum]